MESTNTTPVLSLDPVPTVRYRTFLLVSNQFGLRAGSVVTAFEGVEPEPGQFAIVETDRGSELVRCWQILNFGRWYESADGETWRADAVELKGAVA